MSTISMSDIKHVFQTGIGCYTIRYILNVRHSRHGDLMPASLTAVVTTRA